MRGFSDTCWNVATDDTIKLLSATTSIGEINVYRYQKAKQTEAEKYYEVDSATEVWALTELKATSKYKKNAVTFTGSIQ